MEISGITNERSCWSCACAYCVKGFNCRDNCEHGSCHGDPNGGNCHMHLIGGSAKECYVAPDTSGDNVWHR